MRRRSFITLLGGAAAAWPLAACGQQTPEVPRIGFVYAGSKAAAALRIEAILSGLRDSGYAAPAQVEIVARTARSMRADECLFLGEKRSCSGHHRNDRN
jgi:putative tryptophan/tyrosine transport system substrate-binding protein